jgi:RES domain-containing protein
MIIYRLAIDKFAMDISGAGAKLNGGRWNPVGVDALYTSEYISLCMLEILARANKDTSPDSYTLISIEAPQSNVYEIQLQKLKSNWQHDVDYTQWIGAEFFRNNRSLILKVPSAIVPQEHNFLVNPLHTEFKKVKIVKTELLQLDERLLLR